MKHKYLIVGSVILLIGALLFGIGWFLTGRSDGVLTGSQELAPFHSIDLSVMSGDVTVRTGDRFSVSYQLHGRETVKRLEVQNETLHFETGFDPIWKPSAGDWNVVITVPEGTVFDTLSLKSTAGAITLENHSFRSGIFETTAGDITLSMITCDTLRAKSVSHDISLLSSSVSQRAELETVAGSIRAEAPFAGIEAKSVGGVRLNGTDQGRKLHLGDGAPMLTAKSVSGSIRIDTN